MKKRHTVQTGWKFIRFSILLITISTCCLNSNAQTVKKYSDEDVKALIGLKYECRMHMH